MSRNVIDDRLRSIRRKKKFRDFMANTAFTLDLVMAFLVVVGIVIGITDILRYFPKILVSDVPYSYDVFRDFLGHVLLLVMGVELIGMLISHSARATIELILYVIARKMLIYGETMTDMMFGAISVAVVFLTAKYFTSRKTEQEDQSDRLDQLYRQEKLDVLQEEKENIDWTDESDEEENKKRYSRIRDEIRSMEMDEEFESELKHLSRDEMMSILLQVRDAEEDDPS